MSQNQRNYFRVDDEIKLSWKPVKENQDDGEIQLKTELIQLNKQLSELISIAFAESAAVGEALGTLNRKLELLTTVHEDGEDLTMKARKVSISGAGIAFLWHSPVPEHSQIDITMILRPSNISVTIRGNVISCGPSQYVQGHHWARVSFEDGQELAVEEIVQHVAHRQTEILQERHLRDELDHELHPDHYQDQ